LLVSIPALTCITLQADEYARPLAEKMSVLIELKKAMGMNLEEVKEFLASEDRLADSASSQAGGCLPVSRHRPVTTHFGGNRPERRWLQPEVGGRTPE